MVEPIIKEVISRTIEKVQQEGISYKPFQGIKEGGSK